MDDYYWWNMHGEGGVNDRDLLAGRMGQHSSEDHISENQQNTGEDGDGLPDFQTGEANCDSQTAGHDLSEDDLVGISDNYVNIADKLEEMVLGITVQSWRN